MLKPIAAIILALSLIISSAVVSFAETYYVYDGYRYRDVDRNAGTASFSGTTEEVAELIVPDKIASRTIVGIDDYLFRNNTVLQSIDLSQAVHLKSIGIGTFRGCTSLQSLTVPETVEYLSEYMLTDCTSLTSLQINMSPRIIPAEMCNRCSSLESVVIPDSVEEIRRYAFGSCTSLSYVEIPESVQTIASSAFSNCPNLTLGVFADSAGYNYAVSKNIPYILLEKYMLGDVNGSGDVTIDDVTAIQRYLAEYITLEGIYYYAADANQDDVVDISDATAIQMYIAEYELPYPIGQYFTKEVVTQENN